MGCYAGFAGIQNAGSFKMVQQLDEIEEQSSSTKEMKCRMVQAQIRCSVQVRCSSAEPSYFNERIDELKMQIEEDSCSERINELEGNQLEME
ncbi:oxysterol-binding protein-related protein 2A [Dorcoceras hygrometricum]|uniref:Oxysterol-binding protein-related protein 2A n=1 Tax=Dorcoceras hygrometricum TaxID=472368 RepID=A0A2Z7BWU2_9LAMI|nr:oxysterol-binding protein-related protein 2A [Dorcoceras hygrometricum]